MKDEGARVGNTGQYNMGGSSSCCCRDDDAVLEGVSRPVEVHRDLATHKQTTVAPSTTAAIEPSSLETAAQFFAAYDSKTPLFSLMDETTVGGKPCRRLARLVGAHDGDTISVVIKLYEDRDGRSKVARFNVRLDGIDTPEMTSKDLSEKVRAIHARNRLVSILTGGQVDLDSLSSTTRPSINAKLCEKVHLVFLECRGMDKYGRVLAALYHPDDLAGGSANQRMLDEGLAKPYQGGTKERWSDD